MKNAISILLFLGLAGCGGGGNGSTANNKTIPSVTQATNDCNNAAVKCGKDPVAWVTACGLIVLSADVIAAGINSSTSCKDAYEGVMLECMAQACDSSEGQKQCQSQYQNQLNSACQ